MVPKSRDNKVIKPFVDILKFADQIFIMEKLKDDYDAIRVEHSLTKFHFILFYII